MEKKTRTTTTTPRKRTTTKKAAAVTEAAEVAPLKVQPAAALETPVAAFEAPLQTAAAASITINEQTYEQQTPETTITFEQIAERAYELWKARGCPLGSPDQDWLEAERELKSSRKLVATA